MWFTEVLTPPGWSSDEPMHQDISEGWEYDTVPSIDPDRIGRTLNEALNRLHAQAWASPGIFELRGTINPTVPPQEEVQVASTLKKLSYDEPQALSIPSTSSPRT